MWVRIWRSLRNFFRRWGRKPTQPVEPPLNPLSDLGYEHLFFSLLQGVEQGWEQAQVLAHLGKRLEDRSFLAWLRRFGDKLRQSAAPQQELATQMVRLGEVGFGELGKVAAELGQELLTREVLPMPELEAEAEPISHIEEAETCLSQGFQQAMVGDFQGAIASWDRAIELKPDSHLALFYKGWVLYALERNEEAIVAYDQALHIKPDYAEAVYRKGAALSDLEHNEEAIAAYDQALNIEPDYAEAVYRKGVALYILERYEEAIAVYDQALHIKPDYAEAFYSKGVVLSILGRKEKAIAVYDQALHIKPDYAEAFYSKGVVLSILGRKEKAIAAYDQALNIKPDYQAFHNKGVVLSYLGRYEEAIASCDQALNLKPDLHQAFANKGLSLSYLGRYEEAIASYDQALNLKPDYAEAWINKGNALSDLGRYEEAIASHDQALNLKPDFCEAWIGRGSAAAHPVQSQTPPGFPLLQNPELNQRGYVGTLASYQEGLKYVQRETQPQGWGNLHWAIGTAHYFQGQTSSEREPHRRNREAIRSFQTALETLTESAFPEDHLETLQGLIRAYLALGEIEAAKQWRERGLRVFQDLLNAQVSQRQRQLLETKFSGFSQIAVDTLVQDGQMIAALEAAERYKNRCLTWMLTAWQAQVTSPSYAQMQRLLDVPVPTAILYWHLSPDTLTLFLLKPHDPLSVNAAQPRQTQRFTTWLKDWDRDYQDYRDKKSQTESRSSHNWRRYLPDRLTQLAQILEIEAIAPYLTDISHLILIPHRDLHRLPLHALFDRRFTITYLPSIQVGLNLQTRPDPSTHLLSIEDPANDETEPMPYAAIESAVLRQLCHNPTRIHAAAATQTAVLEALAQPHAILHFTGHAAYNSHTPADSALGLAGSDRLTAQTLRSLDLSTYDLISLAACETALTGMESINTEYVGLGSACLCASAAHVLSTLWNVEEISNAWLTIRFYQLYRSGIVPAAALQQAQDWLRTVTYAQLSDWLSELLPLLTSEPSFHDRLSSHIRNIQSDPSKINSEQPPYADPYYWAAFTLMGRLTVS